MIPSYPFAPRPALGPFQMNQPSELLVDLRERMVRIETKLDTHAEYQTQNRADLDDHEDRITKLEGNNRILIAVGSILIFLITFFQASIQKFLGA